MIVWGLSARRRGEAVGLQAQIASESDAFRPQCLWIEVDRGYEEWIDTSANALLPSATALATAVGEDLRVEGPLSPRLVRGAEQASRLYAEWWGYRATRIDAADAAEDGAEGPGTGLFYSGGIDSAATLHRSLDGTIGERVTHLLTVRELNPHYSRRTERRAWQRTEAAAAEYELPLVALRTNTPSLLRKSMGWTRAFGAVLAGTALALGPLLSRQLFGATVDDALPRPRGSHPDLDPLWGTERTTFRQDATELQKGDRVAYLAGEPRALRHLKVCWIPDTPGNCGRCFKCVTVMTYFSITGTHEWKRAFDRELTPEAVSALDLRRGQLSKVMDQIVPAIPADMPELRSAWALRAQEVQEHGPRRSRAQRSARALRRMKRRAGRSAGRRWRRTRRRARAALGRS